MLFTQTQLTKLIYLSHILLKLFGGTTKSSLELSYCSFDEKGKEASISGVFLLSFDFLCPISYFSTSFMIFCYFKWLHFVISFIFHDSNNHIFVISGVPTKLKSASMYFLYSILFSSSSQLNIGNIYLLLWVAFWKFSDHTSMINLSIHGSMTTIIAPICMIS